MSDATDEPAIEVCGLSKRYGAKRRPPGLPEWLWRRSVDGQGRDRDDLEDDDDLEEEEDEEPDEPEHPVDRDVWALRGVSLELARGASLGVVGPNGSGKTTLLNVLSRVTPPTEGSVIVRGRVAPAMVASKVLQAELTGRKNAYLLATFLGVPRHVVDRRMDAIAEFTEVGPLLDSKLRTYSDGLRKRFGPGIVLNLEADVLLADDSLTVGDADYRERCLGRLEDARAAGLAAVFASHDLDMIRRFCDDVILMEEGRIVERGTPDEIARLRIDRRAEQRALFIAGYEEEPSHANADWAAGAGAAGRAAGLEPREVGSWLELRGPYVSDAPRSRLAPGERNGLYLALLERERGADEVLRLVDAAERLAETDNAAGRPRWTHVASVAGVPVEQARSTVDNLMVQAGTPIKRRVFDDRAAILSGAITALDGRALGVLPAHEDAWLDTRVELATGSVTAICVATLVPSRGPYVRLVQPRPAVFGKGPYRVRVRIPAGLVAPGSYSVDLELRTSADDVLQRIAHPGLFALDAEGGTSSRPDAGAPLELVWTIQALNAASRDGKAGSSLTAPREPTSAGAAR